MCETKRKWKRQEGRGVRFAGMTQKWAFSEKVSQWWSVTKGSSDLDVDQPTGLTALELLLRVPPTCHLLQLR